MDFKYIYNENHTVILPGTALFTLKWADGLNSAIDNLIEEGDTGFIVDLGECNVEDIQVLQKLIEIHEHCYSEGCSLVFTNLDAANMAWIKKSDVDHKLNIAPKMQEAIDIITMEQLERDLFNEE